MLNRGVSPDPHSCDYFLSLKTFQIYPTLNKIFFKRPRNANVKKKKTKEENLFCDNTWGSIFAPGFYFFINSLLRCNFFLLIRSIHENISLKFQAYPKSAPVHISSHNCLTPSC